jgi:hypothetical protein
VSGPSATVAIGGLLEEYERALDHTEHLWSDLSVAEVHWRPHERSSGIGWHLGHQAAVAHFMIRNLTAAEGLIDPPLDSLMDSATPEPDRGDLPSLDRLRSYREAVADRVRVGIGDIVAGDVGAPEQLAIVAVAVLTAIVNHEYQHDQWIAEVRRGSLGRPLPPRPTSPRLTTADGYVVLAPTWR